MQGSAFAGVAPFLRELHPIVKLITTILIFIYALATPSPTALLLYLVLLWGFLLLAGLGGQLRGPLPYVSAAAVIVFVVGWLFGGTFPMALAAAVRFFYLFFSFTLFVGSTSPNEFLRALHQARLPWMLRVGLLITMRFIPVLKEDMTKIIQSFSLRVDKGQRSLGLMYRGMLVPFLFRMMSLSDQIAMNLQMRGFGTERQQTRYRDVSFGSYDLVFLLANLVIMGTIRWRF